jgi:hypothetical protein
MMKAFKADMSKWIEIRRRSTFAFRRFWNVNIRGAVSKQVDSYLQRRVALLCCFRGDRKISARNSAGSKARGSAFFKRSREMRKSMDPVWFRGWRLISWLGWIDWIASNMRKDERKKTECQTQVGELETRHDCSS